MKAPLKWLLAYTDIKYEDTKEFAENVASLMTLSGSKVETVDRLVEDEVFRLAGERDPEPHLLLHTL